MQTRELAAEPNIFVLCRSNFAIRVVHFIEIESAILADWRGRRFPGACGPGAIQGKTRDSAHRLAPLPRTKD